MKLLIVEDHEPTRDLLLRSLEEAGHSVVLAVDSASALERWGEQPFELAILDVALPDGSGIDLCRALRARGLKLPILFLTAHGEVEDRISGLDAGGDDYLRKPYATAELRARIRALARRPAAAPPQRMDHGGVSIDFAARRLCRDETQVTLTAREWAVLEILATHAGQVVARQDVLQFAWPRPGAGASESLDVIVSRLRRKLGGEGAVQIRTVRGQGFVFEFAA